MIKLLSLVLGFVVYVSGQRCFPDQWQASVELHTPYQPFGQNTTWWNSFIDYTKQRGRIDIENIGVSILGLYQEGVTYTFNTTSCQKEKSGPWIALRCLPKTAIPSKPYRLGWQQNITVTDYSWLQHEDVAILVSMTDTALIDLYGWYLIDGQWELDARQSCREFVPYIVKKDTFEVPKICMTALETRSDHTEKDAFPVFGGQVYKRNKAVSTLLGLT